MATADRDVTRNPIRVFGAELRHYRTRAGLSQEQLGARIHFSDDMVGKIENGQRAPTEAFTAACDTVPELATGGALSRLREHLRDALRMRAFPGWFHDWPGQEAKATTLRTFELAYVPGLLQTEEYARAVFQTRLMATEDEVNEMVAVRMERQTILDRVRPPMLWAVVDEHALARPVGGREVMRKQLEQLAESAQRPHVVVQVVPRTVGAYEGLKGPFVIAGFDDAPTVAYLETPARGQVIDDAEGIAALTAIWDTIRAEVLPRSASLAVLEEAAESWT